MQATVPLSLATSALPDGSRVELSIEPQVAVAFQLTRDRYFILDGLRGVAALAVLIFHHRSWYFGEHVLAHSYIAVDFFFMLSGFVIAHAYERRLAGGMSVARFTRVRLIRLYPLVLLSLGIALGVEMTKLFVGNDGGVGLGPLLKVFVPNLLLIPQAAPGVFRDSPFPMNIVLWSLFFEIVANVLYAAIRPWLGRRLLALLIVASGATLIVGASQADDYLHLGTTPALFWWGLPRSLFAFFIGVWLFRTHAVDGRTRVVLPFWLLALGLLGLCTLPKVSPLVDVAIIAAVLPLIVVAGTARLSDHSRTARLCEVLGRLSYPVYLLHLPIYAFLAALERHMGSMLPPIAGAVAAAIVIASAWCADRFFDHPVRRQFMRRLAPAQASAR